MRSPSRALLGLMLAAGVYLALPTAAHADVVDDAYARGSEAATAGNYEAAIAAWQEALDLLPGRSAQLDYDLGTAYAQLGQLGPATYHLERALAAEARPSVEVAEAARRNAGIVRRRAELQAEVNDAHISRELSTWDRVTAVLAGRGLAWLSLACGWIFVALVVWRRRQRVGASASPGLASPLNALVLVFGLLFGLGGALHALALETSDRNPEAVALDAVVDAREGPGAHLPVAFTIQGGSHLRVLEQRSGWLRVRMPGGLEGWTATSAIARLDKAPVRSPVRADATTTP